MPAETVRRRYGRGLANLFRRYLAMADYGAIFDNSFAVPELVYERTPKDERVVQPEAYGRIRKRTEDGE